MDNDEIDIVTITQLIDIDVNTVCQESNCPHCDVELTREDAYNHIRNHYVIMFRHIFEQQGEYLNYHRNRQRNENRNTYVCNICNLRFRTVMALNEHVGEDHDDYAQLYRLDENMIFDEPFIGFDKLANDMKMFEWIDKDDEKFKEDSKESDYCLICVDKYNGFFDKESYDNNEAVYPAILTCCKKYICHNCIQKSVHGKKNIAKCPWCRHVHDKNKYDNLNNNVDNDESNEEENNDESNEEENNDESNEEENAVDNDLDIHIMNMIINFIEECDN